VAQKRSELTLPDLVLLSLLAEIPMHGYQANLELERREVRAWAGISRPQIYYSLEKLAELGFIGTVKDDRAAAGPKRRVYSTTRKGKRALARALAEKHWALQRERPGFLIWLALSWQASPRTFAAQLRRRREFLQRELARSTAVLQSVRQEVGHEAHEAVWILKSFIARFRLELQWLKRVQRESAHRAAARFPQRVNSQV
jgi:DNA-binding PadR family transcriptional regulator